MGNFPIHVLAKMIRFAHTNCEELGSQLARLEEKLAAERELLERAERDMLALLREKYEAKDAEARFVRIKE